MNIEAFIEKLRKKQNGKSFAVLAERCATSEDAPYRIRMAENLRPDEPTVLVLGGSGGNLESYNGMLKQVDNFIHQQPEFDKVRVCIAVCDFGEYHDDVTARRGMYHDDKWLQELKKNNANVAEVCWEETFNPSYIRDIFDAAVLPRIAQNKGKERRSLERALQYTRGLNIVGHCHAGYVAMQLEKMMGEKMTELGYLPQEQKQIKSQLMVLAYNPDCPKRNAESYFVSIESAKDDHNEYNNYFKEWLLMSPKDFDVCYLPKRWGRTLMCSRVDKHKKKVYVAIPVDEWFANLHKPRKRETLGEHDFMGFIPVKNMSKGAIKLQKMANNILKNAVKNSLQQRERFVPLPKIQNLVADTIGQKAMFAKAAVVGYALQQRLFWTDIKKIDQHATERMSIPRVNIR